MPDLKLFRVEAGHARELPGAAIALEKPLQVLIEANMETMLGVRFLATEYSTGAKHRGRIDSLGLDENGSPVIIEYKRAQNENVINQGLFYLDWLMDHRGEFTLLVTQQLGQEAARQIDWSSPRLICIAGDFTRYDEYAVQQIDRSIELIRYRDFGGELLALELSTSASGSSAPVISGGQRDRGGSGSTRSAQQPKTVSEYLAQAPETLRNLYADLDAMLTARGDDVQLKTLKYYFAYKRLKNFACVEVHPQKHTLLVYLKVDPDTVTLKEGFTRDVRSIGHYGTGDLEVRITSRPDLDLAADLIQRSYETG